MGRLGDFARCGNVPHRLDLHPARRRRASDEQYDDYVFGAFGRADFHKNAVAQLGRRVSGQFGGNAGDGVFPRTLRRDDRRQRGGKTIAVAEAKVHMDFGRAFVSAVACNWMVCMGAWLHFAAKHTAGRMLAIWFPVMIFVLNGFQHLVANMFVIPAGILAGADITWGQFFFNMIPVFLGNVLGGASFVGASYLYTYKDTLKDCAE